VARSRFATDRSGRASGPATLAGSLALLSLCGLAGCFLPWSTRPDPPVLGGEALVHPAPPEARTAGSLWRDNVSANYLFADVRARFPGDMLTIVLNESTSGDKEATTKTSTKTTIAESIADFFGLPQALQAHNPNINPASLINASSDREWDGEGATTRSGTLTGTMTAKITAVSPTGNLFVEGDKVVSVNHEDQHIVLSGWVRPEDIDSQNQVPSTRLASARIDYYGVGVVGIKQRPLWGHQILDLLWPF